MITFSSARLHSTRRMRWLANSRPSLCRRTALAIALRQLLNFLRFDQDSCRVWAEVDLIAEIAQLPSKRAAVFAYGDSIEIGSILQWCKDRTAVDQVGEVVFAGEAVIECYSQHRIADNFNAFDCVIHSIIPP